MGERRLPRVDLRPIGYLLKPEMGGAKAAFCAGDGKWKLEEDEEGKVCSQERKEQGREEPRRKGTLGGTGFDSGKD